MAKGKYNARKRKVKKNVPVGVVHIQATYNNTLVTITDLDGNALCWASSGTQGIKGSKKSTPYAAGKSAEIAGNKAATEYGMKEVSVSVSGVGQGREAAIRNLQAAGLVVTKIIDETPVPHNGCRPPKKRRG